MGIKKARQPVGGLILHIPQRGECAGNPHRRKAPRQAKHALAALVMSDAGFTSRQYHQLGAERGVGQVGKAENRVGKVELRGHAATVGGGVGEQLHDTVAGGQGGEGVS